MVVPLVLFLLLAYIRKLYKTTAGGPYFFAQEDLFPLSGLLWGSNDFTSQAFVDLQTARAKAPCGENCTWEYPLDEATQLIVDGQDPGAKRSDPLDIQERLRSSIEQGILCSGDIEYFAASGSLDSVLNFRASWTNGSTLQEAIGSNTIAEATAWVKKALGGFVRSTSDYIDEAERMREEYLSSSWRSYIDDFADTLDAELPAWLWDLQNISEAALANRTAEELSKIGSHFVFMNESEDVRRVVEDAVDKMCKAFGPALTWPTKYGGFHLSGAGWNLMENASAVLDDLSLLADEMELAGENATIGLLKAISDELRKFADLLKAGGMINATTVDLDLDRLFSDINRFVQAVNGTEAFGQAVDSAIREWAANQDLLNGTRLAQELDAVAYALQMLPTASSLAKDLKQMSKWLEATGWAALVRDTVAKGGGSLADLLKQVSAKVNTTGGPTQIDSWAEALGQTHVLAQVKVWLDELPSTEVAEFADTWAWWTSHFLSARSTTVQVLDGLLNASWLKDGETTTLGATDDAQGRLNGMRTEVGVAVNRTVLHIRQWIQQSLNSTSWYGEYNTDRQILISAVEKARSELEGKTWTMENVWDLVRSELDVTDADIGKWLIDAGLDPEEWLGPMSGVNISELIAALSKMSLMDMPDNASGSVFGDNVTGLSLKDVVALLDILRSLDEIQIEQDIVPMLTALFQAQCGEIVNTAAVVDLILRVNKCPFFKGALNQMAERGFHARESVDAGHRWLRDLDIGQLRRWQAKLAVWTVENTDQIAEAIVSAVNDAQHRVEDALGTDQAHADGHNSKSCLRVATNGCQMVSDESSCLSSRHGFGGKPCAWCYDGPCSTLGPQRCRVKDQVESADSRLSKNYAVADRPCGVGGNLATLFIDEYKAKRDLKCPTLAQIAASQKRAETSRLTTQTYLEEQVAKRKILISPYKGEVKELFDYFLVELAQSVLEPPSLDAVPDLLPGLSELNDAFAQLAHSLVRCPLARAVTTKYVKDWLEARIVFLDSEAAVEDFAINRADEVLLALVFKSADEATGNFPPGEVSVDYSIRLHAQLVPATDSIISLSSGAMFGQARITSYPYLDLYFTQIQEGFGRATARLQAHRKLHEKMGGRRLSEEDDVRSQVLLNALANDATELGRRLDVGLEQFPAPMYTKDGFIRTIQNTLPMLMILGWIYAVSLLVREMVYEKQERLRDVMRIMGLQTWVYWASWMASAFIQLLILVILMTAILSLGNVLKYSDRSLIFVFFLLYSLSTIALALFISSFFSRAKVAAACGGLTYYVLYLPCALYNRFDDSMGTHAKNALCLMSSSALGVGMAIVGKWELLQVGAKWNNLFKTPPITGTGNAPRDDHCLGYVFLMLILDTALYMLGAWYVERVFPGTLGLPLPWYFPFLPSYWFPKKSTWDDTSGAECKETVENARLECWEAAPEGLDITVKIRQLAKTFRNGKKALKGITLDMHQDTIVGLLGHNGAGKSTTMSILTGLYPPTSGDVLVNGMSVCKNSVGVRRQLGVCLQHNALYANFTVQEHMRLFCSLKSVPRKEMQGEIDRLLHDVGLSQKRHAQTRALSGGMKRKLSICIALTGGSKVVTLDEPTAGVDATSRRDIWQLLAHHKLGRTILLSTHFMDEADILSDRIAIIAEGTISAIGTSLHLKRHFTEGYMLNVVLADGKNIERLQAVIVAAVPAAKFAGSRGRELSYVLPFDSRSCFATLFQSLQDDKVRTDVGVDAYGLSAATMEEVFLKASSLHEEGLHGIVRNVGGQGQQPATSDGDSTADSSGSHSKQPSFEKEETSEMSATGPKKDPDRPSVPKSVNVTSPMFGGEKSPGKASSAASSEDDATSVVVVAEQGAGGERPRSPQCGAASTPRACTPEEASNAKMSANKLVDSERDIPEKPAPVFGIALWFQQFDALIRKRALSVRRDRRAWASQLLLPALFVLIALIVARLLGVEESMPALKLSSDMFIGEVDGGRASVSTVQNRIHFSGSEVHPLAQKVEQAFVVSAAPHDRYVHFAEDTEPFSEYYMENIRKLASDFGAVTMRSSGEDVNMTLWFNNQDLHSIPVMTNLWNNARLRLLGYNEARVQVWNHPLPKTQALLQEELTSSTQVMTDLTVAITVILAMGFVPASFVVYLVQEKASQGKHQQYLTGVRPSMYWVNSYAWDMLNFIVPLGVCCLIFIAFQVGAYSGKNMFAVFMTLLLYGFCMTPCMYCVEPFFSVPSTAYVTLIVCNIFTGTLSVLAVTVMDLYKVDAPELGPINEVCKAIFPWILPNYNLGRSFIAIATNHYMNLAVEMFGICVFPKEPDCMHDPMSHDVAGQYLVYLLVMSPVWFALRMMIEWGFCLRGVKRRATLSVRYMLGGAGSISSGQGDEAVKAEAARVKATLAGAKSAGGSAAEHLVIHDLAKSFTKYSISEGGMVTFHAVRGINVGVPAGECFGLLGVNGAGKTTTMRMITGDTEASRGEIFVGGCSIVSNRDRARQHLGYCPQFDAIPDKLTVRETVALYARIRGVPRASLKDVVDEMIRRMCLEAHQYNLCENLSGGNKRKLSTALALIGEPDVVLLDEPSTGVDVGARRFLWEVIGDIRKSGHSVILTSHSMEECEVLCTRLTIMVHGQFRCLGSPTQLKNIYGGGYTMMIKANLDGENARGDSNDGPCSRIRGFVEREVPCAKPTEESVGLFRYKVGADGGTSEVPLADIFHKLELASGTDGELHGAILDYAISQTSLEEVFLHFSQVGEREYAIEKGAAVELPTAAKSIVVPIDEVLVGVHQVEMPPAEHQDATPEGVGEIRLEKDRAPTPSPSWRCATAAEEIDDVHVTVEEADGSRKYEDGVFHI